MWRRRTGSEAPSHTLLLLGVVVVAAAVLGILAMQLGGFGRQALNQADGQPLQDVLDFVQRATSSDSTP